MKLRVLCKYDGTCGTVVKSYGRGRYGVEWDEPTPYQEEAKPIIPSSLFEWLEQ